MKPKEKEFCRFMAVYGEPMRAAKEAGYKHPENWPRLVCREDIAAEIRGCSASLRTVYQETAVSGLYRLAFGNPADALKLLYNENPSDKELEALDLSAVAEVRRTKDKSVEIKLYDRVKALDRLNDILNSSRELNPSGGLLEAMRLSAQALGRRGGSEGETDGI